MPRPSLGGLSPVSKACSALSLSGFSGCNNCASSGTSALSAAFSALGGAFSALGGAFSALSALSVVAPEGQLSIVPLYELVVGLLVTKCVVHEACATGGSALNNRAWGAASGVVRVVIV